jgi:hypothetical protein
MRSRPDVLRPVAVVEPRLDVELAHGPRGAARVDVDERERSFELEDEAGGGRGR